MRGSPLILVAQLPPEPWCLVERTNQPGHSSERTMVSPGELEELDSQANVVFGVADDLFAKAATVVLCPSVYEPVVLFAGMPSPCNQPTEERLHVVRSSVFICFVQGETHQRCLLCHLRRTRADL
jgi:hypothetical protein